MQTQHTHVEQRQDDYRAYLRSPEWQELRKAALKRAGGRCQVCNNPERLEVHHRTYERIFEETLDDLTVLCRRCHETHHVRRRRKKARQRARQKALERAQARKLQPDPMVEFDEYKLRRLEQLP